MSIIHPFREADDRIISLLGQNGLDKRKGEDALFTKYVYYIREGIRKHGLPEEEVFNAYSDSVLAVIDSISHGTFQGRSSLKTYLYQIFHNKCVDLLRKAATNKNRSHRAESISERLLLLSDKARSAVQVLIDKADWSLLRERLSKLGEDCRNLLMLWAENYSDKEIAAMTNYKTADVVKTSRLRCMQKLRRSYQNSI